MKATTSMANILKNRTNSLISHLLPKQQILNPSQRTLFPIVDEMVPAARVAIHHRRRLHPLFAVRPAPFTFERVVGVARRPRFELEQLPQRIEREMALHILRRVDHTRRQRLFMRLSLKDLLLDGARRDEAVHETILLLAVAPDSRQGLLVGGRVPVRIKEDEPVAPDEIEAAAARFAAEQEDELGAVRVVEFVDEFLTLVDVHGAVEAEHAVVAGAAELVEDVERLRVIADQDDLVVGVLPDARQHAVEDLHFARIPGSDIAIAASCLLGYVIIREERFATGEVGGQIEEVGVVAEFLEHPDGLERLRAFAPEQRLDVWTIDEEVVEVHLEGGQIAEDDVLVFDG